MSESAAKEPASKCRDNSTFPEQLFLPFICNNITVTAKYVQPKVSDRPRRFKIFVFEDNESETLETMKALCCQKQLL
ncbi:hypothetical protein ACOSQ3_020057 [Xanthoceras sorbifolium]